MARPTEKMKSLAQQLNGTVSEPKEFESTKAGLMAGLNFYSKNSDSKHSKAWALEYLKKTNPAQAKRLAGAKDYLFGNRGYLCRMISRGYVADAEAIKDLDSYFTDIKLSRDVESDVVLKAPVKVEQKVARVARVVREINESMMSLDEQLDNAMESKKVGAFIFSTTKRADLEFVINKSKEILKDLNDNREDYLVKTIHQIRPVLKAAVVEATKLIDHINKNKTKLPVSAVKNLTPSQMVKDVKYMKEEVTLKLRSIPITSVVGARKCYVYDVEKRRIMLFVSVDAKGLMFSGTTIKNYDPDKCEGKTVRKPEVFFGNFTKGLSMSAINTAYSAIAGKSTPVLTGRTNEALMFLKVSD